MTLPLHSNNSDEIPEADSRRDNEIVVCDQLKHFTVEVQIDRGSLHIVTSLKHLPSSFCLSAIMVAF